MGEQREGRGRGKARGGGVRTCPSPLARPGPPPPLPPLLPRRTIISPPSRPCTRRPDRSRAPAADLPSRWPLRSGFPAGAGRLPAHPSRSLSHRARPALGSARPKGEWGGDAGEMGCMEEGWVGWGGRYRGGGGAERDGEVEGGEGGEGGGERGRGNQGGIREGRSSRLSLLLPPPPQAAITNDQRFRRRSRRSSRRPSVVAVAAGRRHRSRSWSLPLPPAAAGAAPPHCAPCARHIARCGTATGSSPENSDSEAISCSRWLRKLC